MNEKRHYIFRTTINYQNLFFFYNLKLHIYTVKITLVLIRIICLYKEVTIPSGIKVIYIALKRPKPQS